MTQSSRDLFMIGAVIAFVALIAFMGYRFLKKNKTSGGGNQNENYYRTELENLRARIADMDNSGNIENYRSANNPALTIVGTLLEKIIDIIITFLDNAASRQLTESIINNTDDGNNIAEYIEQIADGVIDTMKSGDMLICATTNSSGNCTNYQLNSQMVNKVVDRIRQELRNISNSTSGQDKLYDATVNILNRQAELMPEVAYDTVPEKDTFVRGMQDFVNSI